MQPFEHFPQILLTFYHLFERSVFEKDIQVNSRLISSFLPLFKSLSLICTCHLFSSVQLLSHVWLSVNPWTAARQASLSITSSQSLLKFMSIELVMPSNHLILSRPLLLLPPSIRVFSNESVLRIRWPKYLSFIFSISPSSEYSELISFKIDWFDLAVQRTLKNLLQHHSWKYQFFGAQRSLWSNSHIHSWLLEKP